MSRLLSRLAVLLLLSPASAHADAAAKARTEALVATFQKLGKDAASDRKVYGELDAFFDYDRLTSVPLAGIEGRFTPAQKAEFETRFRELIRGLSFGDAGGFFRRAKLTYGPVREQDGAAVVPIDAFDPENDVDTTIEFHWARTGSGPLRIVDASFDGTSLVKDYRNQFSRIVEKEGAAGLLERMAKRRAEAEGKGKFAK